MHYNFKTISFGIYSGLSGYLFIVSFSLLVVFAVRYGQFRIGHPEPLPPWGVTELGGVVVSDSRDLKGRREMFDLHITTYKGRDSLEIFKGKVICVVTDSRELFFKGQVLSVKVGGKYTGKDVLYASKKDIFPVKWKNGIYELRSTVLRKVLQKINILDEKASLIFTAFFLGRKNKLEEGIFESFIKAGAAHLLALSGMHLGIISSFLIVLTFPLFGKKMSFIFSVPILALYIFLTGLSPSLLRAFIFYVLLGSGIAFSKKPDVIHVLVYTLLVHVIVYPSSIVTVSFKLSYSALFGVLIFGKRINNKLPGFVPLPLRSIIAASIGAQIATLPVVVSTFGVFYSAGIFSSIILIPMVTVFLLLGIIYLFLPPGFIVSIIVFCMDNFGKVLYAITSFFSSFPSAVIDPGCLGLVLFAEVLTLTIVFLVEYLLFRKKGTLQAGRHGTT